MATAHQVLRDVLLAPSCLDSILSDAALVWAGHLGLVALAIADNFEDIAPAWLDTAAMLLCDCLPT